VFFADTSAFAKRYLVEVGTQWVLSWILPSHNNVIIISELGLVEMTSLLARNRRSGNLNQTKMGLLRINFLYHARDEYLVIAVDNYILQQARLLVDKYPLRTLDAIQLACAIRANHITNTSMTFVTADNNLYNAAVGEGFTVDNPIQHP
jgi:predicted nucleic acid-binding protein